MSPEELKTIVDQVTAAVTTRPTPPAAPPMLPLSAMVVPPAGNMAMPPAAAPTAVTVAITIPLPDGSEASGHLQFSAEAVQNLASELADLLRTIMFCLGIAAIQGLKNTTALHPCPPAPRREGTS